MKKVLSIIVTVSVLFSALIIPVSAKSTTHIYGAFKYKIKNNVVQITGYKGKNKKIKIPSHINGKKVRSIGKLAFIGKTITSVVIPNTVTVIEKLAFGECYKLKEVRLGKSVTTLKSEAFSDCDVLQRIKFPKRLKHIGKRAFQSCYKLSNVQFPKSLEYIGKQAFSYTKIENITLGRNVKICKDTFYGDEYIKSIKVNKNNKYISSKNNALYNKKKTILLLYSNASKNKSFSLPKTVTKISALAFYQNSYLENIKFNNKLITIEREAFKKCKKLKSVKFPNSLKTIGIKAFELCERLESVYIPNSVKKISLEAFWYCLKLKTLVINPNNNLEIESLAFRATALEQLNVPYAAKRGLGIFENCWKLKTISIPEKVDKISDNEFLNCSELKEVTIPATVKEIGEYSLGFIEDDLIHSKVKDFTIKGYKGTAAEKYATDNGFKFVELD